MAGGVLSSPVNQCPNNVIRVGTHWPSVITSQPLFGPASLVTRPRFTPRSGRMGFAGRCGDTANQIARTATRSHALVSSIAPY